MNFPETARFENHPFFSGLSPRDREALFRCGSQRRLALGATIFMKNDPGDALYVILSGRVEIVSNSPEGKQVLVTTLGAGDVFGEIAVLDGLGRTADAVALSEVTLVQIPRDRFLKFAAERGDFLLKILKLLCERLRRTTESFEDAMLLSVEARLIKRLLAGTEIGVSGRFEIAASQSEIAHDIGASREFVSRQLQMLKSLGLVALGRKSIIVRDVNELRRFAGERSTTDK